ncbi:hypothetical protein [Microcoleus sp. F10-D1]|uniref:hypothetical protein n=1 Tax=Microcoleus sp. F10-D1 TaxID=2818758 RepID=UPI002FCFDD1E
MAKQRSKSDLPTKMCPVCVSSATGKMPVPQELNFVVEQASCLLIKMVQDVN